MPTKRIEYDVASNRFATLKEARKEARKIERATGYPAGSQAIVRYEWYGNKLSDYKTTRIQ